jgi:hypothetical protein
MQVRGTVAVVLVLLFAGAPVAVVAQDDDRDALIARENEQREAMLTGMQAVIDGLNAGSFAVLAGSIDQDDMLERIFGLRLIDQRVQKQFREQFETSLEPSIAATVPRRPDDPIEARLAGFTSRGKLGKAVVRYDLANFQFAYHEYELTLDDKDRLVIVDWTDFFWGDKFSDAVGNKLVIASPSSSAVRKLVDFQGITEAQMFKLTEALKAIRDRQVPRYFEIVEGMDERLRQQRVVVLGGVQMTKQVRARRQLRTALTALAEYYPDDPLYTTLLLDYFFPTRRYDDAKTSLLNLKGRLGIDDAAMEARLSSTELVLGNAEAAVQHAERAVELEEGLELGWWAALRARTAAGDYAGAVASLTVLENRFGHELTPEALAKDKSLAGFVGSEEYRQWAQGRTGSGG